MYLYFWSLITKNYAIKQFFCTGTFSGTEFDDNNTEKYTIFTSQGRYITSTTKTTSVFRFPTQADRDIWQTRKIFLLDSAYKTNFSFISIAIIIVCSEIPLSKYSYHIETSQLICFENQLTGFYMIRVFAKRCFRTGCRAFSLIVCPEIPYSKISYYIETIQPEGYFEKALKLYHETVTP